MSSARVTLDDPVFVGRLRQFSRGTPFVHVPKTPTRPRVINDVTLKSTVISEPRQANKVSHNRPLRAIQPVPTMPAMPRLDHSKVLQRKITSVPSATKRKVKTSVSQKLLMSMASLVFFAGMAVAVFGFMGNQHVETQVQAAVQQIREEGVDEDKPSTEAIANYRVDPSLPRTIKISKLGVYARVQRQGTDSKGMLKAPGNVHDAGWYENSSKPGENGAMLLDGHVSGPSKPGVFHDIKKLVAGDLIEIERGDGQKFTYKVVKSTISEASKTDMYDALTPVTEGKAGLNLITCTGKFDAKTKEYQQRIIVFAEQV